MGGGVPTVPGDLARRLSRTAGERVCADRVLQRSQSVDDAPAPGDGPADRAGAAHPWTQSRTGARRHRRTVPPRHGRCLRLRHVHRGRGGRLPHRDQRRLGHSRPAPRGAGGRRRDLAALAADDRRDRRRRPAYLHGAAAALLRGASRLQPGPSRPPALPRARRVDPRRAARRVPRPVRSRGPGSHPHRHRRCGRRPARRRRPARAAGVRDRHLHRRRLAVDRIVGLRDRDGSAGGPGLRRDQPGPDLHRHLRQRHQRGLSHRGVAGRDARPHRRHRGRLRPHDATHVLELAHHRSARPSHRAAGDRGHGRHRCQPPGRLDGLARGPLRQLPRLPVLPRLPALRARHRRLRVRRPGSMPTRAT